MSWWKNPKVYFVGYGSKGHRKVSEDHRVEYFRGIVELLSYFLHEKKLVDEGFQLNHRWFKSGRVGERLPDFENKGAVVEKMVELENLSEKLIYGAPKTLEKIKRTFELYRDLEEIVLADVK